MTDKTASERIEEAFARMSEPTELKVGQVWRPKGFIHGTEIEIVAVGPEWVAVTVIGSGLYPRILSRASLNGAALVLPKPPRHVLWVNVFRGGNGDIYLRQTATREEADLRAAQTIAMIHANTVRIACFQLEFEEGTGL